MRKTRAKMSRHNFEKLFGMEFERLGDGSLSFVPTPDGTVIQTFTGYSKKRPGKQAKYVRLGDSIFESKTWRSLAEFLLKKNIIKVAPGKCRALKLSGELCSRPTAGETKVCRFHGGRSRNGSNVRSS